MKTKVLAFAGSTREDSMNKKLIALAAKAARECDSDVSLIDLRDYPLPLYDGDLETREGLPKNAKYIQDLMLASQVIFIASPEYNSSLTGVLKNTIDWVSRSEKGEGNLEAFKGKTFVIMSASPSSRGGSRGLIHLRSILQNVGGVVAEGEFRVSDAYNAFNEQGQFKDSAKDQELKAFIRASCIKS